MKIIAYVVGGLVVLAVVVVAGAFIAVNTISWNAYKPEVAAAVRDATGRDLRIDGDLDIGLSAGLELSFAASGVHLANAPGMEPAEMVSLADVRGQVRLWPYLTGRDVVVDSFVVTRPVVNLAVDAEGRPNWVLDGEKQPAEAGRPGEPDDEPPFRRLRIGELRIADGTVTYADATTGQRVEASQIALGFALTDLGEPLEVDGSMVLNREPVTLTLEVDTPATLLNGPAAQTRLALASTHVSAGYDGRVLRQAVTGLDGTFTLDIPSVGRLAAWLDRPLADGQPDPGPLQVRAVFAGEGARVALTEATIAGQALEARASGSIDASGEVTRIALDVESGVLDIDRYLPPGDRATAAAPARGGAGRPGDPLAALPDDPIDLSALRRTEADVKVAIAGLKMAGYELGRIDFTAQARDGVLTAELARLALYGGGVAARATLDAKTDSPALATTVTVDQVQVDQLAEAATGERSVTGRLDADVDLASTGASPRALAQNLTGKLGLRLAGTQGGAAGALSAADITVELPGLDRQPTLRGSLVYNQETVDVAATLDPLQKVLQEDRFDAEVKLAAAPLTLAYAGAVQHRPLPGADGRLDLEVPSVARLAAWLGQPLPDGQPDPGPLEVVAVMATQGEAVVLKEATIAGKAIDARANGKLENAEPPRFDLKVDVLQANLDAYLPPESKQAGGAPGGGPGPADADGWSREPIDFSALKQANGKAEVSLAKVTYRGLQIDKGVVVATVEGGNLDLQVQDVALADGRIDAAAVVDASGDGAAVRYTASVKSVQARPLLTAFAGSDRLSGTANIEAEGTTRGGSQYDLVRALNGKGSVKFLDGAIHGINLAATLRKAQALGLDQGAGETQQTDFAELGGTYVITDGVVDNRDFAMLAPLLRLSGAGKVPMPPRQVDYGVEAKLVASLEGQGGKDALAGLPIPIRVTGSWSDPKIAADWDSVFKSLASDPERLANLPNDLAARAKDFGVALPDVGGKAGEILKGVTGGAKEGGGAVDPRKAPVDALKGLLRRN